jgi:hypothetical protein
MESKEVAKEEPKGAAKEVTKETHATKRAKCSHDGHQKGLFGKLSLFKTTDDMHIHLDSRIRFE